MTQTSRGFMSSQFIPFQINPSAFAAHNFDIPSQVYFKYIQFILKFDIYVDYQDIFIYVVWALRLYKPKTTRPSAKERGTQIRDDTGLPLATADHPTGYPVTKRLQLSKVGLNTRV